MEYQQLNQAQPLLPSQPIDPTAGKISVRFCVSQEAGCLNSCCSFCCKAKILNAVQLVVPDTTTVGEFLHMLNEMFKPKEEYDIALINGFQLSRDDLLAPTIRSFENFDSPIVVYPKKACCLLI